MNDSISWKLLVPCPKVLLYPLYLSQSAQSTTYNPNTASESKPKTSGLLQIRQLVQVKLSIDNLYMYLKHNTHQEAGSNFPYVQIFKWKHKPV